MYSIRSSLCGSFRLVIGKLWA